MNVFALLRTKRQPKVRVPRETLWGRTLRYYRALKASPPETK